MDKLKLIIPTKEYEEKVMLYKEAFIKNNGSFDGCAGLEEIQTYDEWLDFAKRLINMETIMFLQMCICVSEEKIINF